MDVLDYLLAILLLAAAVHGARLGATAQLLSFGGFLVGLAVGAACVLVVAPHVGGQLSKTIVALLLLTIPASVCGVLGRRVGSQVSRVARRLRVGLLDAAAGVMISAAGTLVICWLFSSVLVNTEVREVSSQIEGSKILQGVQAVLPPVPDAFAAVQRYLAASGFPQVLVDALPEPLGPVRTATAAQRARAAAAAGRSTVRVVAIGCGQEQEGSGFAVSARLYVTNAHVVAGTTDVTVQAPDGRAARATVVEFDPRFDLAVLESSPLGTPALRIDPGEVARGTAAVVLGYPEGGPFDAREAGVSDRFEAQGRDIYDQSVVDRTVYQLQAIVRPGNSGGPLVTPSGEVIGVVFSRSASNPDVGYALASPGVLARVRATEAAPRATSTEGCTE